MVPTQSWAGWSLPGHYAWSLSGLYLVSTWSLPSSTWTLPGLTGTNMSLRGLHVVPTLYLHVLSDPYMVSTRFWADSLLSGHYLAASWSLHYLYLVPIWSLCSRNLFCTVNMWTLRGSYTACLVPTGFLPVLVPTWSIPHHCLVYNWSIYVLFLVPTSYFPVLGGPYMVPMWSLRVPTWSLWSIQGPYLVLVHT